MAFKESVVLPTTVETPYVESNELRTIPVRTSNNASSVNVIVDYKTLYKWVCSKCSFVALFGDFHLGESQK